MVTPQLAAAFFRGPTQRWQQTRPATAEYSMHTGPRFVAAGLRIQFHYNQVPGIHFRVAVPEEYRRPIERGLADAMANRFPEFPASGSIWTNELMDDPVDSSETAFYIAAVAATVLAVRYDTKGPCR